MSRENETIIGVQIILYLQDHIPGTCTLVFELIINESQDFLQDIYTKYMIN